MHDTPTAPRLAPADDTPRRPWQTPRLDRLPAADAQNGATNIVSDGVFSMSS